MGVKHLRIPEETIDTPGGKLTVRGVSLPDIVALVRHHGPAMSGLFSKVMSGGDVRLNLESIGALGQELLTQAPAAAVELIVLAADDDPNDPEAIDTVRRLSFPVQLEALEKIGRLTFETEGGIKKVAETVIRVASGMSGAVAELNTPSKNGSGASAQT